MSTHVQACPYKHKTLETTLVIPREENSLTEDLKKWNALFLSSNALLKESIRSNILLSQTVIFIKEDDLIVRSPNGRRVYTYVPPLYHQLKAIAHTFCGVFALDALESMQTAPQTQLKVQALYNAFCTMGEKLMQQIQHSETCSDLRKYTHAFQQIYEGFTRNKEERQKILTELRPFVFKLLSEAAKSYLDALHNQMKQLTKEISPEDWRSVSVIVMGQSMPRIGDLAMQYFSGLFNKPLEQHPVVDCPYLKKIEKSNITPSNQRLIYAENIFDEESAINLLLVTQISDEKMGNAILGDSMAMHVNVLSEPTSSYLDTVKDQWKIELGIQAMPAKI